VRASAGRWRDALRRDATVAAARIPSPGRGTMLTLGSPQGHAAGPVLPEGYAPAASRRPATWVTCSFSMSFDDHHTEELRRSVQLTVQSADEMVERADFDHWARWVLHSSDVDYVPEPAPCTNGELAREPARA
jgi:hypothetical protein